jgi:hypothetical protein
MPEGPGKRAMMKEMGNANTAMSNGDMRGACKSCMRAQKNGFDQKLKALWRPAGSRLRTF